MSGRIIPLHGDLHAEASALLAWYVTGRIEPEDRERVEAHLATCAQCQADLATERRLQALVNQTPAAEPGAAGTDAGWEKLSRRLTPRPPRWRGLDRLGRQWSESAVWLRWAVAAQLVLLTGAGFLLSARPVPAPPAQYHTLGAAPAATPANIVVIFRPDVTEAQLRATLRLSHARIVDGPTAADAWMLHVEPAGRDRIVEQLRHQSIVVLAEPIGAGETPGATP